MKTKYIVIYLIIIALLIIAWLNKDKIVALYLKSGGTLPSGTTLYKTPSFTPDMAQGADKYGVPKDMQGSEPDHIPTDAEANKDDIFENNDINAYDAIHSFNPLNNTI